MVGLRRQRCAALVTLWLLAGALLAPLKEAGDLLESVVTYPQRPLWTAVDPGPPSIQAQARHGCPGAPATGLATARYAMATGPSNELVAAALEPLSALPDPPATGVLVVAAS